MAAVRSVKLFFQEGVSDKLYCATIVEDGGLYTVKVEWGRRGSTLSQGNKAVKVPLAAAEKTFDKLVREKTGKGHQPIAAPADEPRRRVRLQSSNSSSVLRSADARRARARPQVRSAWIFSS